MWEVLFPSHIHIGFFSNFIIFALYLSTIIQTTRKVSKSCGWPESLSDSQFFTSFTCVHFWLNMVHICAMECSDISQDFLKNVLMQSLCNCENQGIIPWPLILFSLISSTTITALSFLDLWLLMLHQEHIRATRTTNIYSKQSSWAIITCSLWLISTANNPNKHLTIENISHNSFLK